MNDNITCPIWGTPTKPTELYRGDGRNVDSPRAGGWYFVDGRAAVMVGNLDAREKARLTTWLIQQRRSGVDRPEIWSYENYIESKIQREDIPVPARADELLQYIQSMTPHIGTEFEFQPSEPPLEMFAYTESVNPEELLSLLDFLIRQGWLEKGRDTLRTRRVAITVEGSDHLAGLEKVETAYSQAFVAMWFDGTLDAAWNEAIKPAIEGSGYTALRIDEQEHLGKIDDQIIEKIRESRFIVADFTHGDDGARGGVYYEAGFAHGLDIPVIFTCRNDVIEHVHFNTRQYNHIVWENPIQLRERLTNRIAKVIGEGPLKSVNKDEVLGASKPQETPK